MKERVFFGTLILLVGFFVYLGTLSSLESQNENRKPSSLPGAYGESLFSSKVSPHVAWDFLNVTPYENGKLPVINVRTRDFVSAAGENLLLKDSKRTVESGRHFIQYQRKLIFPMGICLRGSWQIDEHPYGYSGYFKSRKRGHLIARAAVALGRYKYAQTRTLALSGKVFPTRYPEDKIRMDAANFLLLNDNAGKSRVYFSEAYMTNAAPRTVTLQSIPLARIGLAISKAFNASDKRRDIRQL